MSPRLARGTCSYKQDFSSSVLSVSIKIMNYFRATPQIKVMNVSKIIISILMSIYFFRFISFLAVQLKSSLFITQIIM